MGHLLDSVASFLRGSMCCLEALRLDVKLHAGMISNSSSPRTVFPHQRLHLDRAGLVRQVIASCPGGMSVKGQIGTYRNSPLR